MSKFNSIFLPVAFTVLIIGLGVYFYNHSKNSEAKDNSNTKSGAIPIDSAQSSASDNTITSYNEYMVKVLDIRGPINKNIEDILSKTKYKTLFNKDEMIKEANDTKSNINDGIKTLNGLKLSSELAEINKKQVKSLELLNEAMDAYIAYQNTDDQTEQQKQSELMSYKIDESNKQIENVTNSSGSNSSGSNNSSSNSSGNAVNILQ